LLSSPCFLPRFSMSFATLAIEKMGDLLLASAAIGLLVGTKYYALGYAGVAAIGVIALLLACRQPRDATRAVAIGLLGVLILGSYWYIRNAIVTGAPIYPRGFTESTDLWGILRPDSHTSSMLRSGRPEVWPLFCNAVTKSAGPAQMAAVILLPVVLLWLAASAWRMRVRMAFPSTLRAWLVLTILLSALVYLMTPNVVETELGTLNMLRSEYHPVRFGLCFFAISVLGVSVALDDVAKALRSGWLSKKEEVSERQPSSLVQQAGGAETRTSELWLWIMGGSAIAVILYQLGRHSWDDLTPVLFFTAFDVLLACALLLAVAKSRFGRKSAVAWLLIIVCCASGFAFACEHGARRWHREFLDHYDGFFRCSAFTVIGQLDPTSERICVCDSRYYPFLGSRREFVVSRPLWLSDYSTLIEYTERNKVTLVVSCHREDNAKRYENVAEWITSSPDAYRQFHKDERYTAVRIPN
jgi:hypothetical protein